MHSIPATEGSKRTERILLPSAGLGSRPQPWACRMGLVSPQTAAAANWEPWLLLFAWQSEPPFPQTPPDTPLEIAGPGPPWLSRYSRRADGLSRPPIWLARKRRAGGAYGQLRRCCPWQ